MMSEYNVLNDEWLRLGIMRMVFGHETSNTELTKGSTMEWTQTQPSHEGWWWWKDHANTERPRYIYRIGGELVADGHEHLVHRLTDNAKYTWWSSEAIALPRD